MARGVDCSEPNMLARSRSPYLRMHACDPVRWVTWEWVEERLGKIGKPLFVSIGYASCHWCHVMQRESFRDPRVAEWLNKVFIPVKVDREERPDIDAYYMEYCQLVRGACGWPLNILADDMGRPFAAFTYLPPEELVRIARAVQEAWTRGEPQRVAEEAHRLLMDITTRSLPAEVNVDDAMNTYLEWAKGVFDREYGGFGRAPKFPMSPYLNAILGIYFRRGDEWSLKAVHHTLSMMAVGGVHDWVGGGIHRYAIDRFWKQPHFEKMLYDQGSLGYVIGVALRTRWDPVLEWLARGIVRVLEGEFLVDGGFASALDAESGGVEGLYYTWTLDELEAALGDLASEVLPLLKVSVEGNVVDEATMEPTGRNVLHIGEPLERIASRLEVSVEEVIELLERAAGRLLRAREEREKPSRDDKVIASWNGLALRGLASMAAAGVEGSLDLALNAAGRLERYLLDGCEVRRAYAMGEAYGVPFLEDYAHLSLGMLELHRVTGDDRFLELSHCLAKGILHFQAIDGSLRQKPGGMVEKSDSAYPSGYSAALEAMERLGRLMDDYKLREAARRAASAIGGVIAVQPQAMPHALLALDIMYGPSFDVVVSRGEGWREALAGVAGEPSHYVTTAVTGEGSYLARIAGYAASMTAINGRATIYVCEEGACSLPTHDIDRALGYIRMRGRRGRARS